MNSKARVVANKHKKKKEKMRELQGNASKEKKIAFAVAKGFIYCNEIERFKRTLSFIDMSRYAGLSEISEGAEIRITLTAPVAWVECMRHSFHNKNGSMYEWGDRFRVSTS